MSKPRNIFGNTVQFLATSATNSFAVAHGLTCKGRPVTPQGFIVIGQNAAGSLYPNLRLTGGGLSTSNFTAGWQFENAGSLGLDSSSNALTLTNSGVSQTSGLVGYSGQFIRSQSDYLYRASEAALQTGDIDFTFAMWVFLDSKVGGDTAILLSKDNTAIAGQREYQIQYNGGLDRMRFQLFRATDSLVAVNADNFGSPPLTSWFFLVCWHDATADTINIQVNNGTANSAATGGALQAGSGAEFRIGARYGVGTFNYDGRLDQVMFFKRVLTSDERTALYNYGSGLSVDASFAPSVLGFDWNSVTANMRSSVAGVTYRVIFFA